MRTGLYLVATFSAGVAHIHGHTPMDLILWLVGISIYLAWESDPP